MGNIFEDNTGNPFNDPEFRKQFLKEKGLLKDDKKDETEGYEILPPSDPVGKEPGKVINPVDIINNASRIPSNVGNVIHDLSGGRGVGALSKTEKSKAIKSSLNKIFTEYNERYGLDLKLNLDSTSDMLAELADPTTFRVYQLYLSNFLDRARSIVYQKILTTILLLLDKIMEPNELLGSELTLADRFTAVDRLINMLGVFTQFQDQLRIEGADTELQKIGNDIKSESSDTGDIRDSQMVKEFMTKMLNNSGIGNNKKEN